ncbi:MAG: glycoside hydrolase family 2 protein [Flavobacteriaceae bacterium]
MKSIYIKLFALLLTFSVSAQNSKQKIYLSGTDAENTKTWDFWVTKGRKSGAWSKIEVPSHWEQQGFGNYNYGRDNVTNGKNFRYHDEEGFYKYQFSVPDNWKDLDINIVFEGSMTDTEVKVNGELAGAVHQGAFYRFKYNISDKLKFGEPNLLEVKVSKMSADKSVNRAERYADYWIFGGIYRPVYLEAMPKEHISWTSVNAKADGTFSMNVHLNKALKGGIVEAKIVDSNGEIVGTANAKTKSKDSVVNVKTTVENPKLWTAETPNLYQVQVSLKKSDQTVYQTKDKFGFRTLELKKGEGLYLNGTKIKMKGVNRHVFWPEYGRTTFPKADLLDVQIIKDMNMNAVRTSHYPPDKNFLRVCDSLGLYVIDELAGWQNSYSTEAGKPLVAEMVKRDANHPSVLYWSNGNEGGHNHELVDEYRKYDLSGRTVIHAHHKPDNAINGVDCNHYEGYYSAEEIMQGPNLYMPTEFLHAMHDGGAAAGLEDMWELHWNSKKGAGGFIWDFADEGIVRTDLNGVIDVNGLNAADGIVGPHREKEASFNAIKEIYSPVHITLQKLTENFNGEIAVENRFHFTNLNQCVFEWELVNFNQKSDDRAGHEVVKSGIANAPDVQPVEKGTLKLDLPANWKESDGLALRVTDPHHNEIYRWVWKIKSNEALLTPLFETGTVNESVEVTEEVNLLTLKANSIRVTFDTKTGMLAKLGNDNSRALPFSNGPVLVSGTSEFKNLKHFKEGDSHVVEVAYTGDLNYVRWTMQPNGWLELNYAYSLSGKYPFSGVSFDFPEGLMLGAKWLGKGPRHVWKNRLKGVVFDVYENSYNTTLAGRTWEYPEFKGYFSDIVWMEFSTMQGKFTVATKEDNLFVRLFDFYAIDSDVQHPTLPVGDVSFLDHIPATGSKMGTNQSSVKGLGPSSDLNTINQPVERTLYFYFGSPKIENKVNNSLPTKQ